MLRPLGATQPRLRASFAVVLVLLVVLGTRMIQLQGVDSAAYSKRALAQRTRTTVLPASRGAITDRWGHVLADDLDLRLVFADPTLEKTPDATAARLAPVLGMPAATLAGDLRRQHTRYVPLKHLVEPSVAARVLGLGDPALGVQHETTRDHPGHDLAAALVGVTGSDTHGETGVEALLDQTLAGTPGQQTDQVDPSGTVIPDTTQVQQPALDGTSVRLTIDRDLQYEAQSALDAEVKAVDAKGGQVIVMDPRSGQVLALASAPEFDADQPVTATTPLAIPALQDPYEPGSVNKVITAAAALEDHVVTPTTPIDVPCSPGCYRFPGRPGTVQDSEVHGYEDLTFTGVLAESSNIGTDIVANRVGRVPFYDTLRAFGLGSPTGLGFPGESSGVLPDVSTWNGAQASTIPFGQGMSVTAMQIADVYATIANNGVRMPASLIRSTVSPSGVVKPYPSPAGTRVVSAATATEIRQMLQAVTTEGTAPAARIPGFNIAGKTGTAQIATKAGYGDQYIASFVGMAPAESPRLVVEVVVDQPTKDHFGGTVAAPVFKQVMGFGLREFDVPPTGAPQADIRTCWGTGYCPIAGQ